MASAAGATAVTSQAQSANSRPPEARSVHPGVWKFQLGTPERITPVQVRHYPPAIGGWDALPAVETCPVTLRGQRCQGGYLISIPLAANQIVYGLGLQLQSFIQRGLKKKLRVNADPKMDSGDSHAPVPFYVTTGGYGVLVDTARYATFYCGNNKVKKREATHAMSDANEADQTALPAAYRRYNFGEPTHVLVHIPEAQGADVYVFGGPTMRAAVQRYNLFAGGGPIPPRWGLGMWYRVKGDYTQQEVLQLAREFRERDIPCDVLGLEPGWQSHAYSCTFVWSGRYPDPGAMLKELSSINFKVNLWEHAFTNPASPLYDGLFSFSGDYEVWGGIVPDFLLPAARKTFAEFHEKEHVSIGVSGYKLDECDNSDFTGNWSWPEISTFPSGADGEQMHCLFGLRYQDAIQSIFEKRRTRTYGLVRSSQALAAPYPYVLYSDLYDHREFIRGLANAGFSGLLWTPELRAAESEEDLIRRLQSTVLSPVALINGWFIKNPPWKQVNREANNAGHIAPNWEQLEAKCRTIMQLRMQLVPYLHAAFVKYHKEGLPPFRALVMDYPDDSKTYTVDDQYMIGDNLLVAPLVAGEKERQIYLPEGYWFDFWTGRKEQGRQTITLQTALEHIPIFVKSGSLLPLAEAPAHANDSSSWRLTVRVYGPNPKTATLYEDNGDWDPPLTAVTFAWDAARGTGSISRSGTETGPRYAVTEWQAII